ncbi:hypothetical protein BC828DRAFT_397389 [Blastocladiella britannica]|nr:hypothetical protein BC828DRAFT_397389 [Blastocladiella britannica]
MNEVVQRRTLPMRKTLRMARPTADRGSPPPTPCCCCCCCCWSPAASAAAVSGSAGIAAGSATAAAAAAPAKSGMDLDAPPPRLADIRRMRPVVDEFPFVTNTSGGCCGDDDPSDPEYDCTDWGSSTDTAAFSPARVTSTGGETKSAGMLVDRGGSRRSAACTATVAVAGMSGRRRSPPMTLGDGVSAIAESDAAVARRDRAMDAVDIIIIEDGGTEGDNAATPDCLLAARVLFAAKAAATLPASLARRHSLTAVPAALVSSLSQSRAVTEAGAAIIARTRCRSVVQCALHSTAAMGVAAGGGAGAASAAWAGGGGPGRLIPRTTGRSNTGVPQNVHRM